MSNHESGNVERTARRHRPAIYAIIAVFIGVALALFFLLPSPIEETEVRQQTSEASPAPQTEPVVENSNDTGVIAAKPNTPGQGNASAPTPAD